MGGRPLCAPLSASYVAGVHPGGSKTKKLQQIYVIHFVCVPQMLYFHICINAYSNFSATPQSSETASAVGSSLMQVFAVMGVPTSIKTDYRAVYTSKKNSKTSVRNDILTILQVFLIILNVRA